MKIKLSILLILLIFFSFCSSSKKMQLYNILKKEIKKNIFSEFEHYLPYSYENSLYAHIRYAPFYNSFGCSGIDVIYSLGSSDFDNNVQALYKANKVPEDLLYDSLDLNKLNSEYYSFSYEHLQKIAIPRVNDDFCRINDTCFPWYDLKVVVLETGKKRVFSNNIDIEYRPNNPICSYSIGALISEQKQQIIYWLFIYK